MKPASVRVEKNTKYWRAVITLPNGEVRRPSLGLQTGMSKRAAVKAAEEIAMGLAARGGFDTGTQTLTFLRWFEVVSEKRGTSRGTSITYHATAKHLRGYFTTDPDIGSIDEKTAEGFREYLIGCGYAEQTVRGHCRRAKIAWTDAERMRHVWGRNPFAAVPTSTVKVDQSWAYVPKENIIKLVPYLPEDIATGMVIARFAALRLSEVCRLRWCDIRREAGLVKIIHHGPRTTKQRARSAPLSPELRAYLPAMESDELVVPRLGHRSGSGLYDVVRAACVGAGIPEISNAFQDLRRSCITDWCTVVPISDVAKMAGNSVQVIMDEYHQVLDEQYTKISSPTAQNVPKTPKVHATLTTDKTAFSGTGRPKAT